MSLGMAVHNAPTDHGGIIPSTLTNTRTILGKQAVRAGDGNFCPKCKVWSVVKASHKHVIFDGRAVAYENDELTCGARILKQQSHTVGNSRGIGLVNTSNTTYSGISSFMGNDTHYFSKFKCVDKETGEPVGNRKYYAISPTLGTIFGVTDGDGFTEEIATTQQEEVTVHFYFEAPSGELITMDDISYE